MERIINIIVERLPEGVYLATSEDIQGLTVEAETAAEAIAEARLVVAALLEMDGHTAPSAVVIDRLTVPLVLAA